MKPYRLHTSFGNEPRLVFSMSALKQKDSSRSYEFALTP